MRWHPHSNSHSRHGDGGVSSAASVSQLGITVAWLLAAARRHLQPLLAGSPPTKSATMILKLGSARGFTVLGLPDGVASSEHPVRH